jgi:GTPase
MSNKLDKQIAHERRRAGETALSDFADYVEKQQQLRKWPGGTAPTGGHDEHDELSILDSLSLSDETHPSAKLKELLLQQTEDYKEKLKNIVSNRIDEGRGETLFDIGLENNLDTMGFSKEEYEQALESVKEAAKGLNAAVKVLMTKNTGLDTDVESAEKHCSGKVLIRRQPDSIDELLEIRVAVVGNGIHFAPGLRTTIF